MLCHCHLELGLCLSASISKYTHKCTRMYRLAFLVNFFCIVAHEERNVEKNGLNVSPTFIRLTLDDKPTFFLLSPGFLFQSTSYDPIVPICKDDLHF